MLIHDNTARCGTISALDEHAYIVEEAAKARTKSINYTISWQLANIILTLDLKTELTKSLIKLTQLTGVFRLKIELNRPP